jgi:hypothetical protein
MFLNHVHLLFISNKNYCIFFFLHRYLETITILHMATIATHRSQVFELHVSCKGDHFDVIPGSETRVIKGCTLIKVHYYDGKHKENVSLDKCYIHVTSYTVSYESDILGQSVTINSSVK